MSKEKVFEFWNKSSCGEIYAEGGGKDIYRTHAITRYTLEPYIKDFVNFDSGFELDVLEIGVGMGADHLEWARSNPRSLTGVDLTEKAFLHTRARFDNEGMQHNVRVADAENLCFEDKSFDIVYS